MKTCTIVCMPNIDSLKLYIGGFFFTVGVICQCPVLYKHSVIYLRSFKFKRHNENLN